MCTSGTWAGGGWCTGGRADPRGAGGQLGRGCGVFRPPPPDRPMDHLPSVSQCRWGGVGVSLRLRKRSRASAGRPSVHPRPSLPGQREGSLGRDGAAHAQDAERAQDLDPARVALGLRGRDVALRGAAQAPLHPRRRRGGRRREGRQGGPPCRRVTARDDFLTEEKKSLIE